MLMLRAPVLSQCQGVAHAFFGRAGGVSAGLYESLNCGTGSGDAPEAVRKNRNRALAALCPVSEMRLATLQQVHGNIALAVRDVWPDIARPQADAMATAREGIVLGILTADCAPVLLADETARVIGAAHAGWRGAHANVTESAIAAMEDLGARRTRIVAAVGPCIRQAAYEVGGDLRSQFLDRDPSASGFFTPGVRAGHWQFDLPGMVSAMLGAAGVAEVGVLSRCTFSEPEAFFSYRRSTHRAERDYGRQLSAIALAAAG